MVNYGYMWWIMPRTMPIHVGAFVAIGIFGQYMYIKRSPAQNGGSSPLWTPGLPLFVAARFVSRVRIDGCPPRVRRRSANRARS